MCLTAFNLTILDRRDGGKLLDEVDAAQNKVESFLSTLGKHKTRGSHLIEIVEAARRVFGLQFRDVTVVEDVCFFFSFT